MQYAGLNKNDFADGKGVCVSFWTQGCPHHCPHCHNPQTWDFNGGLPLPIDIEEQIIDAIKANNILRNFSILGGEPLCPENIELVNKIVSKVRQEYPTIKIFIWTGYTIEELNKRNDSIIQNILSNINVLIDGRYIEAERDITLPLRGSKNQRILYKGKDF